MSGIARKIQRNKMKKAIKARGTKRTAPLSQYRFKTKEEMLEEQSNAIVEDMARRMKR